MSASLIGQSGQARIAPLCSSSFTWVTLLFAVWWLLSSEAAARMHRIAAHELFGDAAPDGRLEQLSQESALAETAMPVLGKGRVVGHGSFEPEPTNMELAGGRARTRMRRAD